MTKVDESVKGYIRKAGRHSNYITIIYERLIREGGGKIDLVWNKMWNDIVIIANQVLQDN